jgi:HAD superfamily hydrolase (TIGR01509 family)
VELIIFDCDGVLIDSELIACAAEANALTEIGYEITLEGVIERFAGMPDKAMYAKIEAELGHKLPDDFRDRVKQKVFEQYRTTLQPIRGVKDVLSSIKSKKCVASSSSPSKLALGLVETGLFEILYPYVFSTTLVERGKPHPDLFLYAANAMNVAAANCIVVEDSVAGVTAAKAAGMRSIGFIGGSHCRSGHAAKLVHAGAEMVIDDLSLLLREIS